MRIKIWLIVSAIAAGTVILSACGGDRATGGAAIQGGSRSTIGQLTAEGLFQRGESESSVTSKASTNNLTYRTVEVSEFKGGSLNTVKVTTTTGQPWKAFIFLPTTAESRGTMVVINRSQNIVDAVLAWDCSASQIFLKNGGITDFENDVCKASAAG